MSALAKLLAFAVILAAVGVGAAAAGSAIDPDAPGGGEEPHAETAGATAGESGHGHAEAAAPAHEDEHAAGDSEHALQLDLRTPTFAAGERQALRFRILDAGGTPVTDFAVEHERRMHVIVVRTDLTGFQHVHPEMRADGTWSVPLTFAEAGEYRVYADFAEGTLAAPVRVSGDGASHAHALPAPDPTADAGDGYTVQLTGNEDAQPGAETKIGFTVRKDGAPVQVEPYLGADGHLVAISEGDLEFLHVHPVDGAFMATFPRAGRYRLFLQVQHGGAVRTAEFTQAVR